MDATTGIFFALAAMVSWGLGDFLTQRTTRVVGSAKTLFFTGLVGFLALSPFVLPSLSDITINTFILLSALSLVVMIATAFDFEALRTGKIAVVEPIVGLEMPMAIGVSLAIVGEAISSQFILIISLVIIGTILTVFKGWHHAKSINVLEKGVLLALIAAVGTALTTVLVGVSSQATTPLVAIWFSHGALMIVGGIAVQMKSGLHTIFGDIKRHPVTIGFQTTADNAAWILFAFSTTLLPISIAAAISGGYVAMAVALGLFINKERIKKHQYLGIVMVSIGIILLSYLFEG